MSTGGEGAERRRCLELDEHYRDFVTKDFEDDTKVGCSVAITRRARLGTRVNILGHSCKKFAASYLRKHDPTIGGREAVIEKHIPGAVIIISISRV
jgi:hypothetical protein